jgi:hypothetical protein
MSGARRPSDTTALGQLRARGAIERRPDGGWLRVEEPPAAGAGFSGGSGENASPLPVRM